MKVCLVTAATVNERRDIAELSNDEKERIPLGVLCLASALEREGIATDVVDLDKLFAAWLAGHNGSCSNWDFSVSVAARLAGHDVRVFGFSSICSSYPVTLRIAEALKQLRPDVAIILGGPQATATAEATLDAFRFVDIVVRGEGEMVLPALLGALTAGESLCSVPGIVFRQCEATIRNPDSPLLTDLDWLPLPAFHLLPYLKELDVLPLEVGRGCPFSCTFCSTSQFFRHTFRTKSVPRILQELSILREQYGVDGVDLMQDNFAVDRDRVVAFCQALRAGHSDLTWSCSARTDCVDDELLDLMQRAGCRGIFLGVESGSDRIQSIIRKGLDIEEARARIRHASLRRIESSVSLISGFYEETMDDLRATARFFVDVLRYDYVDPQLTVLSPLSGTSIQVQHRDRLVLDDIVSDMAFQGLELDARDRDLIAAHPSVFASYYSVPTPWLDRRVLHELRYFLLNLRYDFRWLLVALDEIAGDTLKVFTAWKAWRAAFGELEGDRCIATYYGGSMFRQHFLAFVKEEFTREHAAVAHVLLALVEYLESLEVRDCTIEPPPESSGLSGPLTGARGFPIRASGVHVTHLGVDLSRIVGCLRRRGRLARIPAEDSTVVTRIREGRTEIVQLSPCSAELLALCDGNRDVRAVADAFGAFGRTFNGVPGRKACLVGLEFLRQEGLIKVAMPQARSQ